MFFSTLRSMTQSRLQNKFILFFVVLACVPVLVLGGITLYVLNLAHQHEVSNLELQVIGEKSEEIKKFFSDTLGVLELYVDSGSIEAIQGDKNSWQEAFTDGMLASNPNFVEVSFVNSDGTEAARKSRFQAGEFIPLDVSETPYFQKARQGGTFIGEVYDTLSGPMITMAAPVRADTAIIQVVVAEVSLSALLRLIESSSFGVSGYVVLIDRNGRMIAQRARGAMEPGFDALQWNRVSSVLKGGVLTGLEAHDRYESMFGAGPVVGAGKYISEVGWAVFVEWPIKDADASIQEVRNQVILVTLASILCVLLFAPLFASRLVRPIRELEMRAKEVEKGNLETKVAIQTGDELEDLGKAFNTMVQGLKRLQELKEEFVFVAAHELRTPVTVIKGYASMLLEGDAGPLTKKVKAFLSGVQEANQRLLQLVEDLLEVARSEAGRIAIEVKDIDIREPIQGAVNELSQLARKKAMSVTYEPSDTAHVLADERRVKEIMINLVGNAIKYTPEKGRVRVFHELRDKELITHIEDNGYGIPQEAQSKIFEKFYRVQSPETRDITGTGLGLFIVKQLVEKMHGTIWFKSKQGKGTTFSFSLPLAS